MIALMPVLGGTGGAVKGGGVKADGVKGVTTKTEGVKGAVVKGCWGAVGGDGTIGVQEQSIVADPNASTV